MFRPSDNRLAYFRTFPCVDVQNCTISDTKTAGFAILAIPESPLTKK